MFYSQTAQMVRCLLFILNENTASKAIRSESEFKLNEEYHFYDYFEHFKCIKTH